MKTGEPRVSIPEDNEFLSHLSDIGQEDAYGLAEAQKHYGNSWKLRGGIGAFMMLARKWDRIEQRVRQRVPFISGRNDHVDDPEYADRYDILMHLFADARGEGLIDDIRDLRRYLMLVEAEARSMRLPCASTTHRDNET